MEELEYRKIDSSRASNIIPRYNLNNIEDADLTEKKVSVNPDFEKVLSSFAPKPKSISKQLDEKNSRVVSARRSNKNIIKNAINCIQYFFEF